MSIKLLTLKKEVVYQLFNEMFIKLNDERFLTIVAWLPILIITKENFKLLLVNTLKIIMKRTISRVVSSQVKGSESDD